MGVSTVSWGDTNNGWRPEVKKRFREPECFGVDDISAAYNKLAQQGGIELWEVAAGGPGPGLLGRCAEVNTQLSLPRVVARCAPTSPVARIHRMMDPWPQLSVRSAGVSVRAAVDQTLEDMGSAYLDLLLVGPRIQRRGPLSTVDLKVALAVGNLQKVARGSVDDVGVANIGGGRALRHAHALFEQRGLRLVACAVDFSILNKKATWDGTLEVAKELDITVLARSPLCRGLASGKYHLGNPTGGEPGDTNVFGATPLWRKRALNRVKNVHEALRNVASQVSARLSEDARAGASKGQAATKVTTAQVALQWIIAKGAVPLPAVKFEKHADEILGCRNWFLTQEEVDILDKVARNGPPPFPRLREVGYAGFW